MNSSPAIPPGLERLFRVEPVIETHELSKRIRTRALSDCDGWTSECPSSHVPELDGAWDWKFTARLNEGIEPSATVGLRFEFFDWSQEVYVLLPGAVYAANRFPVFRTSYSPIAPREGHPVGVPLQTEVPRLSYEPGASCMRQMSSDPSFPGIGFWFPKQKTALWILTPAKNVHGLFGYELEENETRGSAVLTVFTPGMTREFEYEICCDRKPSTWRSRDLQAGEQFDIPVRLVSFAADSIQALFDSVPTVRRCFVPAPAIRHDIPFSEVWRILEDKYLRENWVEPQGYFAIGVEPMRSRTYTQNWQMGWTGGMIIPHALFLGGAESTAELCLRNFDFVFPRGQAPSGYFYADGDGTNFFPDAIRYREENRCLVRKNADGLFYMLLTLAAAEERGWGHKIKPEWFAGLQRCADAFVRTWDTYGEWGHFISQETGEVVIPGSASGALAPAALLLAARRFPERAADYRRVAVAAAEHFDKNFLQKGYTVGGPGDAAQCADSESLAGLVESFTMLFEETNDPHWLDAARRAATHAASWTVSYDFPFPPESVFGKLGMLANGTVLANAQNKHSAPGICTHSGLSLLRLYRHSGITWIMDLLRDIAHTIPQYMSRADRPIEWSMPYNLPEDPHEKTLRPGWMCERVNLTYWGGAEKPGEVFYYSCWSEVALLLTIVELPGVYAHSDTREVWSLDHIDTAWTESGLRLRNTTPWPARCAVLIEPKAGCAATPWDIARKRIVHHEILPGAELIIPS